jgi:hypothetical protein
MLCLNGQTFSSRTGRTSGLPSWIITCHNLIFASIGFGGKTFLSKVPEKRALPWPATFPQDSLDLQIPFSYIQTTPKRALIKLMSRSRVLFVKSSPATPQLPRSLTPSDSLPKPVGGRKKAGAEKAPGDFFGHTKWFLRV